MTLRCAGCGEYLAPDDVDVDWHVRVDHDPGCWGGGDYCDKHCPVQVQCGPVEEVDE